MKQVHIFGVGQVNLAIYLCPHKLGSICCKSEIFVSVIDAIFSLLLHERAGGEQVKEGSGWITELV